MSPHSLFSSKTWFLQHEYTNTYGDVCLTFIHEVPLLAVRVVWCVWCDVLWAVCGVLWAVCGVLCVVFYGLCVVCCGLCVVCCGLCVVCCAVGCVLCVVCCVFFLSFLFSFLVPETINSPQTSTHSDTIWCTPVQLQQHVCHFSARQRHQPTQQRVLSIFNISITYCTLKF